MIRRNADTLLFTVGGVFGIVLVGEKVTAYELASEAIFQTYTVLFGMSKRLIVNNNSVVI